MADSGCALHRRALLQSRQGAISGLRAVLGIRLRAIACRNFWAERTRQHLRARGEVHQGAGPRQTEPAAIGRHAVLRSRQDRGCNRADDGDLAGSRRCGAVVDNARSQTRVAKRPLISLAARDQTSPVSPSLRLLTGDTTTPSALRPNRVSAALACARTPPETCRQRRTR